MEIVNNEKEVFEMPESDESVISLAINRPELSLFKHQMKLIEANYDMSQTSLYPKIGLLGLVFLLSLE